MRCITRVHGSLVCAFLLTAVCSLTSVATGTSCPSDTSLLEGGVTGWCLRNYTASPINFCEAVRTCRQRGEQMVGKAVLDAIQAIPSANIFVSSSSRYLWVGLTDALLERGSNKDGWVWLDTGSATTPVDGGLYFESTEPNDLTSQDCVTAFTSDRKLRDAACNENNGFYCYSSATAGGGDAASATPQAVSRRFVSRGIAAYSQPDPGCSSGPITSASLLHCAQSCFTYGTAGDCVGVYWHPSRLQCVLLPYFDAAVQLGFSSEEDKRLWKKFVGAVEQ